MEDVMDWHLILSIAVGMACGFILMDLLRLAAELVFFILVTLVMLARATVGALVDLWRR
jgi:hypothetical protein